MANTERVHVTLDEVIAHFEQLEDPRSHVNLRHPLVSVVVIAIMAILAGAGGPTAIATWACTKEELLSEQLPLPYGVPKKDVFRRVLGTLQPAAFQACFVEWLQTLQRRAAEATGVDRPCIAIDGKTLRRSHDRKKGLGALHSVSAWASDYGLSLGQVATDEKSNEITAIPELLRLIDLRGAIITIDAMGTQTAIAKQIVEGGGDYALALKGNQGTLQQGVVDQMDRSLENDFEGSGARRHVTTETGHGREETRVYIQMPVPKDLPGHRRWAGLRTIGMVMSIRSCNGKQTCETRYYISSLQMGVKRFAHAVRSHWSIENGCHWTLDVTYREDESRIRNEHLRENVAWLNRFTLSLLKQRQRKQSIAMMRRLCAWDDRYMLEVLTENTS